MNTHPGAETWQRTRILEAAYGIVQREGCENLTMRGVAAWLGQSPASLYRHFDGLSELTIALADRVAAELLKHLQQLPPAADAGLRLQAFGRAFIEWHVARPEFFRLSFLVGSRSADGLPPDHRLLHFLVALFKEGRATGVFLHDDDIIAAAHYLATLHGAVYLALSRSLGHDAERDRLMERAAALALRPNGT